MKLTENGNMAAMSDTLKRDNARAPNALHSGGAVHSGGTRSLLFLREEELRLAQDLLYFGYRDFTAGADRILATLEMGRAHHRVLHFVGRAPGIKVGELLAILDITKQSLGRVLQPMIEQGYVHQAPGLTDKRQRLLSLTEQGAALERRLFDAQREWVLRAYREAGPQAVEGFRQVMRGLMGPEARQQFEALERSAAPGRTTSTFAPNIGGPHLGPRTESRGS